ncbi:hypothetical protein DAEQUDRAFT_671028, partial [Daedalea quercina L-15889]
MLSLANFSSTFEKLDAAGKNWLTFQQHFQIVVRQKKVRNHFDGTMPCPVPAAATGLTPEEQATANAWQEKEDLAMYLLTQELPDITFMKHCRKGTAAEIRGAIIQEFTQKSLLLCANM